MKCGDVVLLNYPFTDDSAAKVRPALVVSADQFNQGEDIIVVPISSAPDPGDPYAYPILDEDAHFKDTGLRQTSCVKWTKPLTISKKLARRHLGHLVAALLSEIRMKIQTIFQ